MVGWASFDIGVALQSPQVADGSGMAVVSRVKDHMELWWIAPNRSIQGAFWYLTQTPNWKKYELAPEKSTASLGKIAALSREAGHMEVWWVSLKGSIEGAFWTDTANRWQRYQLAKDGSAIAQSAIHAHSRKPTAMDVWWIGPHGSIEGCVWDASTNPWKPYHVTNASSAALTSSLTGVSRLPGTKEIWWVGPDGSVEGAYWYEGDTHMTPYQIAPARRASIGAGIKGQSRIPEIMDLFWITPDGSDALVEGALVGSGRVRVHLAPRRWRSGAIRPADVIYCAGA